MYEEMHSTEKARGFIHNSFSCFWEYSRCESTTPPHCAIVFRLTSLCWFPVSSISCLLLVFFLFISFKHGWYTYFPLTVKYGQLLRVFRPKWNTCFSEETVNYLRFIYGAIAFIEVKLHEWENDMGGAPWSRLKVSKSEQSTFHVCCLLCLTVAELHPWVCDIGLLAAVNFETLFTPTGFMSNKPHYVALTETKSINFFDCVSFPEGSLKGVPADTIDVVRKKSKTACQDQQLLGRLSRVSHNPTKSFSGNLLLPFL